MLELLEGVMNNSSHSLRACPQCQTHYKRSATVCPFCGADSDASAPRSGLWRALSAGRSSVIAASILGLSAAPACVPQGTNPTPGSDVSVQDSATQPPDVPILPPYGIPPEDIQPQPVDAIEDAGPADVLPQPPYGTPAEPDND